MSEKKQILIEVPVEVVDWLSREGTENFRSIRSEAAFKLTEQFKATGGKIGEVSPVQDELADAATPAAIQ